MASVKRYSIFCKVCDREIGVVDILGDERVRYVSEDGLYTVRKRSDGQWGFHCCICNSYSCVAPEEVPKAIENARAITPARRFFLTNVVANRKTKIKKLKDGLEVDGFIMQEVAV